MIAAEAYELTTPGAATDFTRVIQFCEQFGPYCLIGGLAVNCYVEPVYTLNIELVINPQNRSTFDPPDSKAISASNSQSTKDTNPFSPAQ